MFSVTVAMDKNDERRNEKGGVGMIKTADARLRPVTGEGYVRWNLSSRSA